MAVHMNHEPWCSCGKCSNSLSPRKIFSEYTVTKEFIDEHNKMKEDIKYLLDRIKYLEQGEGF